jgi:hypothetical protein
MRICFSPLFMERRLGNDFHSIEKSFPQAGLARNDERIIPVLLRIENRHSR